MQLMRGYPLKPSLRSRCPVAKNISKLQARPQLPAKTRLSVYAAVSVNEDAPLMDEDDGIPYVPVDPSTSRPGGCNGDPILLAIGLPMTSDVILTAHPSDPATSRPGGRSGADTFSATAPLTSNTSMPEEPFDPVVSRPGTSVLPTGGFNDVNGAAPTNVLDPAPTNVLDPASSLSSPGVRHGGTVVPVIDLITMAHFMPAEPASSRTGGHV